MKRPTHAAFSKKSTCTASYGNSILPSAVLSSTPHASKACTSPCTALTSRPVRRAASRMVTGPAPLRAWIRSNRFPPKVCISDCGEEKLYLGPCACPVSMARTASARLSVREQTSIVSVFMVVPPNVIQKIGHQLARGAEFINAICFPFVPVIALACLVVVSHDAHTIDHVSQAVL